MYIYVVDNRTLWFSPPPSTLKASMQIYEDICELILAQLWDLHAHTWAKDNHEYRPDTHRAPFIKYSLISKMWTRSAQVYIYRSISIQYDGHFESVRAGLTHPVRGPVLQDSVRMLDVQLCLNHSRLAIPVKDLHHIIRLCPRLIQLNLRIGPGVQALWTRLSEETKLRDAARPLTSLRALQISLGERCTKSLVLTQLFDLFPPSTLSFCTIASSEDLPPHPEFEDSWDTVRMDEPCFVHWPLDLNVRDTPIPQLWSNGPQIDTLRIYQEGDSEQTIRLLRLAQPTLRQFIAIDENSWDFVLSGPMLRKAIRWSSWYCPSRAKFYIAELKSDEDAGKEEEGEGEGEGEGGGGGEVNASAPAPEPETSKAKSEVWTLECRHEVSFGGLDDRRPLLEALSGREQPDGYSHFPTSTRMFVAMRKTTDIHVNRV